MAKKKVRVESEFVLFDVLYEDGSRRSNRRVPSSELDGPNGDEEAKYILEAQDRELSTLSGQPRPPIQSVSRSPTR
ncbi:MAG TPA: hypothetical protein VM661_05770 [Candidatus Sulfotelmatobacter sp.]|jgi:hypothetical protein|nr:hypothetical protein [Candidatus Sulfotelmatobacter sp.]